MLKGVVKEVRRNPWRILRASKGNPKVILSGNPQGGCSGNPKGSVGRTEGILKDSSGNPEGILRESNPKGTPKGS